MPAESVKAEEMNTHVIKEADSENLLVYYLKPKSSVGWGTPS